MTGNRRKFTSFFPPLLHAAHLNKLHNPKGCVCVGGGGVLGNPGAKEGNSSNFGNLGKRGGGGQKSVPDC